LNGIPAVMRYISGQPETPAGARAMIEASGPLPFSVKMAALPSNEKSAMSANLPTSLEQQAARALQVAQRVHAIEPFRVMEMVKAAAELTRSGVDVISMSVGEPDFTAPEMVAAAAVEAIRGGITQYTESLGLRELRAAIAAHYMNTYGLEIDN